MAKKVQIPVMGGLRKSVTIPGAQGNGTTIAGFEGQSVTIGQLQLALGVTVTKPNTQGTGGGASTASIVPGQGLSGGGPLVGPVTVRLSAPIPAFVFEEGGGGGDGDPGPPGINGAAGAAGAVGPIGPAGPSGGPVGPAGVATFLAGNDGEDGDIGPPGAKGLAGATGAAGPAGPSVIWVPEDYYADDPIVVGAVAAPTATVTAIAAPATVADLQYWFQADICAGNSTAGNYIPSMQNSAPASSYSPLQLSKGAKRAASNLNAKAVAVYDGSTTGYLFQQGGIFLGQITAFVVYNPATAAYGDFLNGAASNALQLRINSSNQLELVCSGIAVVGDSTAAFTTGSWAQGNATYNSTTGAYAFRMARAAAGSGTAVETISANSVSLCYSAQGNTEYLNGSLAEIIVYNRVLLSTEITTVENYLLAKWGV